MMLINQTTSSKSFARYCVICSKKLDITVYSNKTYTGGHYFGKIELGKKKKAEYWECNKCYKN